jgi:streptogramin lyase
MPTSTWKPEFTPRALELWEDYQRQHDLSSQVGMVAAIDPVSGRVWIDESGVDVVAQMRSEGADLPVYFVRIGYPSFIKKGRR